MGNAFNTVSKFAGVGTIFFVVGAATGGAGWAALTSYGGTIATGVGNTVSGAGQAVSWMAGFVPPSA